MSKYKVDEKDLRYSYSVAELETMARRIYDLKELYPKDFRQTLKKKANLLTDEIENYLSKVIEKQNDDQFVESSHLSDIINNSLDVVLEGYKDDFLIESKKVVACPACKSVNIARNVTIGVNTSDVISNLDNEGECLDCGCKVNLTNIK